MRIGWMWAVLPLLGMATEAGATTKSFLDLCSSGTIRTCASVQLSSIPLAEGGTRVWLRVRNLQGTLAEDNTQGSLITRLGLTHPSLQGVGGLVVQAEGGAGEFADGKKAEAPGTYWTITDVGIGGQVTFAAGTQGTMGGILGCDPADSDPKSYFQTCGDPTVAGDEGWVAFSFTTTNAWDAADGQVAWKVQATTADGNSYECRSADANCVAVTPEPASLALLSGGLLGLGYLRRRKAAHEGAGAEEAPPGDELA